MTLNEDRLKEIIGEIKEAQDKARDYKTKALEGTIKNIKNAFESYWKEKYLPRASELIKAIDQGIPVPVLAVCGRGTQEIRYTRYLGYFLDPGKSHGIGSSLLKAVLGPHAEDLPEKWTEECQVISEMWIGDYTNKQGEKQGCLCDIGVIGDNFAFIIEQKILSSEDAGSQIGLSQLKRYSDVLDKNPNYKNSRVIKIFLTPTGRVPEGALGWRPLSYYQVIERAYGVYKGGRLTTVARGNLRRFLMDLIMGPYRETEELVEDLKKSSELLLEETFNLNAITRFRRLLEENQLLINLLMEES